MTDRELLQEALDALKDSNRYSLLEDIRARLAQPEQYTQAHRDCEESNKNFAEENLRLIKRIVSLEAAQRQPLTDGQICEFADCYGVDAVGYDRCIAFARAVEVAHNIKETK